MAKFYYKGLDASGVRVSGEVEAGDAWLARKELGRLNLRGLELKESAFAARAEAWLARAGSLTDRVSVEERLVFLSQLETGLAVGIPLLALLELVEGEIRHAGFRAAVRAVAKDVAQGSSLHQAFARHPDFFDATFVGLVRTGEASGQLERVLQRLFRLTEQASENRARVRSALFYPVIVICFLVVVVFAVCYFVIPKIKAFLASFGQELPFVTRFVVGASDFLLTFAPLLILLGVGAVWAARRYYATERGRRAVHRQLLRWPVLGPFFLQVEMNNFCVVLELLLESGITLSDGLEMLERSQPNQIVRDELKRVRDRVLAGTSLREAMAASPVFPRPLVGLVGVGEEGGRVPEVLRRMGKHYQLQVDHRLQNLPKLIEPALLAVIFACTLVLALAIFLPIWQMSSAIHGAH